MSVMSIEWHQQCLTNFNASLAEKNRQLDRLKAEIARMYEDSDFRHFQIREAIRLGKTGYDAEKFCKKSKTVSKVQEAK